MPSTSAASSARGPPMRGRHLLRAAASGGRACGRRRGRSRGCAGRRPARPARTPRRGRRGPTASRRSRTRLGAPPWRGPLSAPSGRHHRRAGVGGGRCHDAGREGGGVEAVVDGADEVLLEGPHGDGIGVGAVELAEVVGHDRAGVGVGRDRARARGGAGTGRRVGRQGRRRPRPGRRRRRSARREVDDRAQPPAAPRRRRWPSAARRRERQAGASASITGATASRQGPERGHVSVGERGAARRRSAGRAPSIRSCHTSSNGLVRASSQASYWR